MNFATALELPRWTAEIQGYSQTVIRYTPIIIKAFGKTIAPQLLTTIKDLSGYYAKCGQGAGAWAMAAAGITHNPIQAAVHAAHAELTSAEAQATYRRLRHIIRESAMDAIVLGLCGVVAVSVGFELAQTGYRTAAQLYRVIYDRLNPSTSPSAGIAIASTELAAALAAAADIAEADIQAKAELVPDFWTEPPSVIHTPSARDMHEEVALQQVPLMLVPASEPVAKPKRSRRKPETQPQQKRKPAAKAEEVKAKPSSRAETTSRKVKATIK